MRFVDARGKKDHAIRVFKPSVELNGYETVGSVVQVVVDDMPFLVDSVANAVIRSGAGIERHLHPVIGTTRDSQGALVAVASARTSPRTESVQHFELDRALSEEEEAKLSDAIEGVLSDVLVSVRDFDAMRNAVAEMIDVAKSSITQYSFEEIDETIDFLNWLLDDNFVFLGYKVYEIGEGDEGLHIQSREGSGLGILSRTDPPSKPIPLSDLPNYVTDRYFGGDLVVITKTNRYATVHRDARMDYIGVRQRNEAGRTETEFRLVGLFTSKAYMATASDIPVLRRKLARILDEQDLIEEATTTKRLSSCSRVSPKTTCLRCPLTT